MSTLILKDTPVAGISFCSLAKNWKEVIPIEIIQEPERAGELEVKLEKEPGNIYDSQAVAIYLNGKHVGYVPRASNSLLADYPTDQLEGKITGLYISEKVTSMRLDIYAKDNQANIIDQEEPREIKTPGSTHPGESIDEDQGNMVQISDDELPAEFDDDLPELHRASARGILPKIKLLVNQGIDINLRSEDGETALYFARDRQTIELLLQLGIDINAQDNLGQTILHIEAWGKVQIPDWTQEERIKYFLEKGANPELQDIYKNTPVVLFIESRHEEVLKIFLDHGIDLDWHDNHGNSYLHFVATPVQAQMLYSAGCRPNVLNYSGESPLHVVQHAEIAEIMIHNGEEVNLVNRVAGFQLPTDKVTINIKPQRICPCGLCLLPSLALWSKRLVMATQNLYASPLLSPITGALLLANCQDLIFR